MENRGKTNAHKPMKTILNDGFAPRRVRSMTFQTVRNHRKSAPTIRGILKVPTKLVISNLDCDVSEANLQELFCEFQSFRKATIHHDCYGYPQGTADVIFDSRTDAFNAVELLNGVVLKERAIKIEVATSNITALKRKVQLITEVPNKNADIKYTNTDNVELKK